VNVDASFLSYFLNSGLVVKFVLLFLVGASILSWSYIIQRRLTLSHIKKENRNFEESFWAGGDLTSLYAQEKQKKFYGLQAIFNAGFKEFLKTQRQQNMRPDAMVESARRAMRVSLMREQEHLENQLPLLATVGSISPYVGLFGTVWGIMLALKSLANVQQATIAMVAPGIAEALIATAMGLFAAIPAVMAYNRFSNECNRLLNQCDGFIDEFSNILLHQAQSATAQTMATAEV